MGKASADSSGPKPTYAEVDELLDMGLIDEPTADLLDSLVVKYSGAPPRPPRCPKPPTEEPRTRLTRPMVQKALDNEEIDQETADLLFGLVDEFGGLPPSAGRPS